MLNNLSTCALNQAVYLVKGLCYPVQALCQEGHLVQAALDKPICFVFSLFLKICTSDTGYTCTYWSGTSLSHDQHTINIGNYEPWLEGSFSVILIWDLCFERTFFSRIIHNKDIDISNAIIECYTKFSWESKQTSMCMNIWISMNIWFLIIFLFSFKFWKIICCNWSLSCHAYSIP